METKNLDPYDSKALFGFLIADLELYLGSQKNNKLYVLYPDKSILSLKYELSKDKRYQEIDFKVGNNGDPLNINIIREQNGDQETLSILFSAKPGSSHLEELPEGLRDHHSFSIIKKFNVILLRDILSDDEGQRITEQQLRELMIYYMSILDHWYTQFPDYEELPKLKLQLSLNLLCSSKKLRQEGLEELGGMEIPEPMRMESRLGHRSFRRLGRGLGGLQV